VSSGHLIVRSNKIYSYHNKVPVKVLSLFTEHEFIRIRGLVTEPEVLAFQADALTVRDRLDVLGFGEARVRAAFERLRAQDVESRAAFRSTVTQWKRYQKGLKGALDSNIEYLRDLTYEEWKAGLYSSVMNGMDIQADTLENRPMLPEDDLDELIALRAICSQLDHREIVTLDLTPLIEGSRIAAYLDEPIDDRQITIAVDRPSPVIVITEGSFDAFVLRSAVEILKPNLRNYIRFLDYEMGHEGSASSAVRTLRSFAAAGVSNRVVAIFDNDSAAHQEVMALRSSKLPDRYRVLHYPDLDLARAYPTFGPQGNSIMDVNGLAGSIELYLGCDVLNSPDGDFEPVQWTGYQAKIKRYQGEVYNKAAIQRAFRSKVRRAQQDPSIVKFQDWSALELVLQSLMSALTEN
jgi:hypothetical protein